MQSGRQQTTSIQSKVVAELEKAPDAEFKHHWAAWEIDILKKYYGKKDTGLIAKLLNRTRTAVMVKGGQIKRGEA